MPTTLTCPTRDPNPLSDLPHLEASRKGRRSKIIMPGQPVAPPIGTLRGMAKTVVLDGEAAFLAERAARRAGMSVSAWVSRATRHEALRIGGLPQPDAETHARYDEKERLTAEGAA